MPINHFSSSDFPKTHYWWALQQPKNNTLMEPITPKTQTLWDMNSQYQHFNFNLNQEDNVVQDLELILPDERADQTTLTTHQEGKHDEKEQEEIREPMFEKPLTPSDVGKLNRLVIPKQNAEKYFPLGGGGGGDSGDKGLLLSFEDESGKSWRFRYSYWNSSQSYVLTKGWSRFVKEKRLDAGDVVLFQRHRVDGDRFFIGWRRRSSTATPAVLQDSSGRVAHLPSHDVVAAASPSTGGGWTRVFYPEHPYPTHPHGPPIPYQPIAHCLHSGSVVQNQTMPSANSKRLRLFGVNLECQLDEAEPPNPDGSHMSSQGQTNFHFDPIAHHPTNHHNHMDVNFSRDVNHMRYRQG